MGDYAPGSAPAPILDLSYAASDVALPGESVPADPYGALAYLEATGGTVSPTVAQLQAAGVLPGSASSSSSVPFTMPSLTDSFSVGGLSIPYWAIGAGVGVWLLSRRK